MPYETDGLASLSLGVGVIVVVLWVILWALRRTPASRFAARNGDCRIMRSLPLGPRERLLVVAIGTKQLVVGVSTAAISLLCELDEPLSPIVPANAGFGDAVRKARERWRGGS
jgi:flagellar protein FliO/FliZ